MTSLKAEKPVGTQLPGQVKKDTAKTNDAASKAPASYKPAAKKAGTKSEPKEKARAIADSLALAGQEISPTEFNAIIFHKLGAEYNGIIGGLQQRAEPMPFNELHGQSHELPLKEQQNSLPTVNVAQHTGSANSNNFQSNNFQQNSFSRGKGRGDQGRRGSSAYQGHLSNRQPHVACQICGYNKHTAFNCKHRFDSTFVPRQNQSFNTKNSVSTKPQANVSVLPTLSDNSTASNPVVDQSFTWHPDTGASHHVTPDLTSLHISDKYKGSDHQENNFAWNQ